MKILVLPWEEITIIENETPYYRTARPIFGNFDKKFYPQVWQDAYGKWWHTPFIKNYTSKQEAMNNLDLKLQNHGYEFITKERAEKLKLLL